LQQGPCDAHVDRTDRMPARQPMKTSVSEAMRSPAAAVLLLAGLLVFGCVHPPLPPLPDMTLAGIDTSPLKNKIIVIDPGHGGPERGAVGVRGLTEAEVNLTVALHLWGLLRQAGAQPELTRSADQALHADADFDLARDLALRAGSAANSGADLFVSVHHNAALDRAVNSLVVFYSMPDPYRSRDAARAVAAALAHRLGRKGHAVYPGNYTVLRTAGCPAILGEPSFISNKDNELDLAFSRTLAAEARGYFDGILDYFSCGAPRVQELGPVVFEEARPRLSTCFDPGHKRAQVDPGSVAITINGTPVSHGGVEGTCLAFRTPELQNGHHRACAAFRNTLGNAAGRCVEIRVAVPARSIAMASSFAVIPPGLSSSTVIDALVLDRLGRPVIDGTPVAFSTSAGTIQPAGTLTSGGRARAVLTAAAHPATATITAVSNNASGRMQVSFAVPETAQLSLSVRDAAGRPVAGAALLCGSRILARSDSDGCMQLETDSGTRLLQLIKQGYESRELVIEPVAGAMVQGSLVLEPIDAGVFFNRTVMLDPEGSCAAVLPVLEALKKRIEHAGGRAILTWNAMPAPGYPARIMRASAERADAFLCVRVRRWGCRAGHYHRSASGLDLAQRIREALAERGLAGRRKCRVVSSTHDAVIHTAMPALELQLPRSLATERPEDAAEALYLALRGWLQERIHQGS